EMCGHGHGIMSAAVTVHTPESYQQTMAAIRDGTYESDYLRRLNGPPTPIPGTVKASDPDSYATLLAKSF
ncbi:MAG: cytochrome C oxidase subunit II, partial [SAR324 cluster bacterium]|nr:cytochrome C oxidase subunit II [SAR324 cluster bacterium]